jgi:hypothetical protein
MEIPLPNGRYAYGRVYKDACLAIYRDTSDAPGQPPFGSREYRFIVGAHDDAFTAQLVRAVGQDAFRPDEDGWPPPMAVRDPISGRYTIYHRGQMTPASATEAADLEPAAVWSLHDIIERIMAVGQP